MAHQDSPQTSLTTPQLIVGVVIMLILIMLMNFAVDWYSQNTEAERERKRAADSARPMPDFRRRESWHPPKPKETEEIESIPEEPPALKPTLHDNTGVRYTGRKKTRALRNSLSIRSRRMTAGTEDVFETVILFLVALSF